MPCFHLRIRRTRWWSRAASSSVTSAGRDARTRRRCSTTCPSCWRTRTSYCPAHPCVAPPPSMWPIPPSWITQSWPLPSGTHTQMHIHSFKVANHYLYITSPSLPFLHIGSNPQGAPPGKDCCVLVPLWPPEQQ